MYVSEDTFVHLRHAAEEQRLRELEYRRVARERAANSAPPVRGGLRRFLRRPAHSSPRPLAHV